MSGSLNKVMIIGHLGRDPEVRAFANGGKVCNLRVATSETWKDKQTGEKRERTEWHSVAIFNDALAGLAEKYLKKGSKVYLEGQLETRKWQDQSGADRYSTEITLRPFNGEMKFLSPAGSGSGGGSGGGYGGGSGGGYGGGSGGGYGGGSGGGSQSNPPQGRDLDDEIPF